MKAELHGQSQLFRPAMGAKYFPASVLRMRRHSIGVTIMADQIIVCDDEPHIVRVIALKLMRADFDVLGASDLESCWKLLHRAEPTKLLIIDDSLPSPRETNQFLRRMRSDERLGKIPVIVLASHDSWQPEQTKELAGLNIARIVEKPFSPRDLLSTVCGLLGHPANVSAGSDQGPRFFDRSRPATSAN
jgi:DNA-binding response OmpR family regulator